MIAIGIFVYLCFDLVSIKIVRAFDNFLNVVKCVLFVNQNFFISKFEIAKKLTVNDRLRRENNSIIVASRLLSSFFYHDDATLKIFVH